VMQPVPDAELAGICRPGRRPWVDGPSRLLPMTPHIYHLALRHAWEAAREAGQPYRRSTIDESLDDEGFIRCSYQDQVQGVADRFYRGRADVLPDHRHPKGEAEVQTENPSGRGVPARGLRRGFIAVPIGSGWKKLTRPRTS
jgi:hypothetical protein